MRIFEVLRNIFKFTSKSSDFEVGDRVTDIDRLGKGEVTSVDEDNTPYPVEVDFADGNSECYTRDGRKWTDGGRVLRRR